MRLISSVTNIICIRICCLWSSNFFLRKTDKLNQKYNNKQKTNKQTNKNPVNFVFLICVTFLSLIFYKTINWYNAFKCIFSIKYLKRKRYLPANCWSMLQGKFLELFTTESVWNFYPRSIFRLVKECLFRKCEI